MPQYKIPEINLDDYDYELPKERIALFPAKNRGDSRLIYTNIQKKSISHHKFQDIVNILPENSLLLMNETKVISARIPMRKPSGGKAEILCTEPMNKEPESAMLEKSQSLWKCIIGGKRIAAGDILYYFDKDKIEFYAEILEKNSNEATVLFNWYPNDLTFAQALEITGKTPLPPYIKRESLDDDKLRYQTVYAKNDGSVAAPTAGLHFTQAILQTLVNKRITQEKVTLHVGPGTFVPVDGAVAEHKMHSERISIDISTINNIKNCVENGKQIICTGTTTLRTLESLYWFGILMEKTSYIEDRISNNNNLPYLEQWFPYRTDINLLSPAKALQNLINYALINDKTYFTANTSLFIMPGYKFRFCRGLITNFHIPKSTLILLVSAFAGKDLWKNTYVEALKNGYQFLSYGDACLFI